MFGFCSFNVTYFNYGFSCHSLPDKEQSSYSHKHGKDENTLFTKFAQHIFRTNLSKLTISIKCLIRIETRHQMVQGKQILYNPCDFWVISAEYKICIQPQILKLFYNTWTITIQSATDWESELQGVLWYRHQLVFVMTLRMTWNMPSCGRLPHLNAGCVCDKVDYYLKNTRAFDILNFIILNCHEQFLLPICWWNKESECRWGCFNLSVTENVASAGIPSLRKYRSLGKYCWLQPELHSEMCLRNRLGF